MAIVQMQKVAILAHLSLKEELLDLLQGQGVLHISEAKGAVRPDHTEVKFREADLQYAIDALKDIASKETVASAARKTKTEEIMHAATHTDVLGMVEQLKQWEAEDTESNRTIAEKGNFIRELSLWRNLPYTLDSSVESQFTTRKTGTVPEASLQELIQTCTKELPRAHLVCIGVDEGVTAVVAHVWHEDAEAFEEIATRHGWSDATLPQQANTPAVLLEEAQTEVLKAQKHIEENAAKRKALSAELPNLIHVQLYMNWLDAKQNVRESMLSTDETLTLLGWLPKASCDKLEATLTQFSKATALLKVRPDEGEDAPVMLKNSKLVTPFESVTGLYGLPLYNELDPTRALSPFFIIYFGLCLTDAGYGAVLALIFGITLLVTRQSIEQAKLLWLLFFSGIVTILVSIPFGGWFGLTPEVVPESLTYLTANGDRYFLGQVWNLNQEEGISFLQNLSLILGLTHLFFGMFLAGWHKWVHGKKVQALWQDFTPHLLLGSVLFFVFAPTELKQIAQYVLYVSIALIIWGKGYGNPWYLRPIMGALGVVNFGIGLLSNGLSYLRILALGLVTGAIAAAVNQVAVEIGNLFPVWIGIPVIVVIFLCGHLVSIALNTLGSFIHSGRLQFIEFFSQFFEGGGEVFNPFRRNTN